MTERIAITGATGFVGGEVVGRLLDEGCALTALVRASSRADVVASLRARGVRLVVGDVLDRAALERAFDGADAVIHSAAVIGYRRRLYGEMERVNVLGTRHVVEACRSRDVARLVHVSSIAAVGVSATPTPLDETAPWNAAPLRAPYFDTKHRAEQIALAAADELDVVVVNPAAIYGASAVGSNSAGLLVEIAEDRVPMVPDGGINGVPLGTVVDGIVAALRRGRRGRRYVLGGENMTIAELFERVDAAMGRPPRRRRRFPGALAPALRTAMEIAEPLVPDTVRFTPDLVGAFGLYLWYDSSRAATELGVTATSFDDCLVDAIEALRRAGVLAPR